MKKIVEKTVKVEEAYCNICDKKVDGDPFNTKRIDIIRGLFKVSDFHGHETCINKVIRMAFEPYIVKKINT